MRPALQALASQQRIIDRQAQVIQAQSARLGQHEQVFSRQRDQITQLSRGIEFLASGLGVTSMLRTAMLRTADEQNPTQPIPEPPAQPAPFTTVDTKTPEAMADVNTPGLVPGSTNDVAADATTTNYTPGLDIPGPPLKNLVDVTAPVDGTQGPRPLSEVRTETDVRAGNPMAPQTAFPLRGDFANAQRLGSAANPIREGAGNRTMASLRLARLRVLAGTAEGDDFAIATTIERDASLSDDAIEREISTLEGVRTASARRSTPPTNLVPRVAAGVQRTVPSMARAAATTSETPDTDASDLFD